MDALDRLKLADNTLVLFTSDNGPVLFDGYFDRSVEDANGHQPADGLRGWKYLVFEGGTRVPFIARWPGHVPAGVSDQMICLSRHAGHLRRADRAANCPKAPARTA